MISKELAQTRYQQPFSKSDSKKCRVPRSSHIQLLKLLVFEPRQIHAASAPIPKDREGVAQSTQR